MIPLATIIIPTLDLPHYFREAIGSALGQKHKNIYNLDLVRPEALADSVEKYRAVIEVLEHDRIFFNQTPKCEPQLGRRGLFKTYSNQLALLLVLNLSDGEHSLLDIAEISGLPFAALEKAATPLVASDLLVSK